MLNITIQSQPIELVLDKSNIEKYDETKGELTLFRIETKEVKEDINDTSFTTQKSYDKKYIVTGFLSQPTFVETLQNLVSQESEVETVTILGQVTSNTEAKLICTVSDVTEGVATTNPN